MTWKDVTVWALRIIVVLSVLTLITTVFGFLWTLVFVAVLSLLCLWLWLELNRLLK